jgi:hypothetical protein
MIVGPALRAGSWPAVVGLSGAAVVLGGCGAAFPAAATLIPVCFALLAAAAAFTLDEPASIVVDVTPTGSARRAGIRAVALLAPLAVGALVMLAGALRGVMLPWPATSLALAGSVLLGFAAACVLRARTGEPGPIAGAAVVLLLIAPDLVPRVARWIRTFPPAGGDGPSSSPLWVTVLGVCVAAIAATLAGNRASAWYLRFVGANVIVSGLGFGVFTIPAIVSVSQGHGILDTFGNPTYGDGPFEQAGIQTTVPLLAAFLAACVVQVIGGVLLLRPRPLGIAVCLAGMLFSAPFWWGFDLPLAWFNASGGLTLLILAWAAQEAFQR